MSETHREVELRLVIDDREALEARLREAGADPIGEGLVRTTAYDFPNRRLRAAGQTVRVREDWTGTTLTSKVPIPHEDAQRHATPLRVRDEINLSLPPAAGTDARRLLESLGLMETLCYEKTRRSWRLDSARIDVDVLADGGACFAEIEAEREDIAAIRTRLALDRAPIEARSYFEIVNRARRRNKQ